MNEFQYVSKKMQLYTVYFIWKLLYMFRVVYPPIIKSANICIYSIWYLSHRYCYLPLSWKSWKWFECAVGGVGRYSIIQTCTLNGHLYSDIYQTQTHSFITYSKHSITH